MLTPDRSRCRHLFKVFDTHGKAVGAGTKCCCSVFQILFFPFQM